MQIPESARALAQIVLGRGFVEVHARLRRDPLAQLFTVRGRSPYPIYERIRAEGAVTASTAGPRPVVDHAVCHEVLRNRRYLTDLPNPPFRGVDLSLLTTDPPDHTRLRRLVAGAFTPARMRAQEEAIRERVDSLLDSMARDLAAGPVDLIKAYAQPLPILVIASLLGIPDFELAALARHGDAIARVLDGLQSMQHYRAVLTARHYLDALFLRLAEHRRTNPGPDLVSDLVAGLDRGELTTEEYQSLCRLVLIAGFETTVNLIGNTVSALLARPELWERFTEDLALVDRVLEESLRWEAPVQAVGRVTSTAVELAGQRLPAGEVIIVLIGGANRDPRVFDEPAEFDIDRPNADSHLSFGYGLHHCLGRPLAMLESRIALTALATRLPGLQPAGPATDLRSFTLRGRATLPVRV